MILSRRIALAAVGWQYLAAIVLLIVLEHGAWKDAPAAAMGLAALATFALVAVPALAVGLALAALLPRRACIRWLCPLPFALTALVIYADSVIGRLYNGLHIDNRAVLELFTAAGRDSVTVGTSTWASGAVVLLVLLLIAIAVAWYSERLIAYGRLPAQRRWWWWIAIVLIGVFLVDKTIYARSDARNDSSYTTVGEHLPMYIPVTARTALGKLGITPLTTRMPALGGGSLVWPKSPLVYAPDAPRPNIVLIAIEGCRFDMLDPAVMPNLAAYAEQAIVGEQHFSGGNATRCGLFSLLYGLWGTSFQRVLAEHKPSLLIDEVVRRGYALSVLSCTDLDYPEFRQTAFVDVGSAVTDSWPGERVDKDRKMTDAAVAFIGATKRPFFSFMFYDASHQPYLYPPEYARFTPVSALGDLDYIKIAADPTPFATPLRNRYRNALGYVDAQLERVIDAIAAAGVAEDTIVVICGDHGEEFAESGFIGHNNSYSRWQTQTTFVLRIPGEAPRHIAALTSHVDVVPTLLARLGVTNPASDFSQGHDLLRAPGDYAVIASWSDAAIVDADGIGVFGTSVANYRFTRYDRDYRRSPTAGPSPARLAEVLRRLGEFQK